MDFARRLSELMAQKNVNKLQLSKDLGISSGLPSAWEKGTKKPSYENIMALADYFHVTTDYLLCRTEVRPAPPAPGLGKREVQLLKAFRDLDSEDQLIELGRIEAMADSERKKRRREEVV